MVTREQLQSYCLAKNAVTESFPFGDDVAVYKVLEKMFALLSSGANVRITLKCDPDKALLLRDIYPAVQGGYYMNKRHWNTITIDGTVPDDELLAMIDDSYRLVVKGLPRADREQLARSTP